MADRQAAIIASSLGLTMAALSPASMAMAKKVEEISGRRGKAEGDVAHPQHRVQPEPLLDQADRLQGLQRPLLLGADGEGQAVDHQVAPLAMPAASARSAIFAATAARPSAVAGMPASSRVRPITAAPYFFTSGRTRSRLFSSP